jgi:hypothetical protein
MQRFIENTRRKEVRMTQMRATQDFPGSTVKPDGTGVVEKGSVFEVTENDAVQLERLGYAERTGKDTSEPTTATPDAGDLRGQLPEDFPGKAALAEAGINTYGQLRKYTGDLTEISGIGPATAEKIKDAISEPA